MALLLFECPPLEKWRTGRQAYPAVRFHGPETAVPSGNSFSLYGLIEVKQSTVHCV